MQRPSAKILVLLSSSLLLLVLGTVHAFSVFLEPLELQFDASRSTVSLTYSLASVVLTFAVLGGHRVFAKIPAAPLVGLICLAAASGALVAAYASSLTMVWVGYSLLFGGANGFGYAFGLQMSALVYPKREGLVMGIVTACYALGATISPAFYAWLVSMGGFRWAMLGLALTLILIAPICVGLFKMSGARFKEGKEATNNTAISGRQLTLLWVGFGAGVAAGLMALGHATAIAKSAGLKQALWIAPVIIAAFNMIGSFSAGWMADRINHVYLLSSLSFLSSVSLLSLSLINNGSAALFALGIVGFAYGALIAVYPATISKLYGTLQGAKIYGKVFTAWGTAGLIAPWFAGFLFDQSGSYSTALTVAAILGVFSTAAAIAFNKCKLDTLH